MSDFGPLMVDVAGFELTPIERERLVHPSVGGVILFGRNYADRHQLVALIESIRRIRPLLIAVDHEGGRVQRFREGFTRLPPMAALGIEYERNPDLATQSAKAIGFLIAVELRVIGVDLSFAPVLDLDFGTSSVIGDRAFHRDPEVVTRLASAFVQGLHSGGLAACGKHFPGHGFVTGDSHTEFPVDRRALSALEQDYRPFAEVPVDAIMPAHVVYPVVDDKPAGFSARWIEILRQKLGFDGLLFSDDLSMAAAGVAGDAIGRVEAAWAAGCDMLLLCNAPDQVDQVLARWKPSPRSAPIRSVNRLRALPMAPAAAACCRATREFELARAAAERLRGIAAA